MKKCCTSYVIEKVKIKTTIEYHHRAIDVAEIRTMITTECWQDSKGREALILCGGNAKLYSHRG
jgi:hypothetical protein